MPNVLDPRTERLRDSIIEAIETLLDTQQARSIRQAAKIIFHSCKRKRTPTGFEMSFFSAFYSGILKWRKDERCEVCNKQATDESLY